MKYMTETGDSTLSQAKTKMKNCDMKIFIKHYSGQEDQLKELQIIIQQKSLSLV